MNYICLILSIVLSVTHPLWPGDHGNNVRIDTSRFSFNSQNRQFQIRDNFQETTISLNSILPINQYEPDNENSYISYNNFSERTNAFEIQKGLFGIQLTSFSAMGQGSAQAAGGRDIFIVYDAEQKFVYDKVLDFGITKSRQRYLGCLSAKTVHFIISDVDGNGLIDIGCIKEELKCEESYDHHLDIDVITGPFFIQYPVEWYIFYKKNWVIDSSYINIDNYMDLPLIDIKLTPIDFFGFIKWHSYNPKEWNRKSEVNFYPRYRLLLMKNN